jgi:hypothetical protein
MGRVLNQWKTVRSKYKQLGDTKRFRPDVAPILAKYEDSKQKIGQLNDQQEKQDAEYEKTKEKLEAAYKAKNDAIDAARHKVVELAQGATSQIRKILDNQTDWTSPLGPHSIKYDELIKKYRQCDAQQEKAGKDHDAAIKQLDAQHKAKSAAIEQAKKKLQTDSVAAAKQLPSIFNAYEKAAKAKDESDLAGAINTVHGMLVGVI